VILLHGAEFNGRGIFYLAPSFNVSSSGKT
jgi:hypothetical protein